MGNELCGRRGVFLDPGTPNWQIGPEGYAAEGLWPEIAGRVCGEIGRLAAFKGRPVVGSVQILGDADPHDYGLPHEHREAIHKFFRYARSRGIYTHSIRTAGACPHCGARHIVGQMLCLSCGAAIIKVSSQKQRKKIKTARWFAAEAASQAAGKPRSQLTAQEVFSEMRRDYSTSRGSQSLDGEALEKAKQQLKQAQKKGFASILDRFDSDVDFTLHSVAGGFDREFLAVEDVLTHSALPNLGRNQEQRTLGVGAYGGGQQAEMARNEAIARLL